MRWSSVYEGLLDWSARLRGVSHSDRFDRAFELLAKFADEPIEEYREFVDDFVAHVDRIPSALAAKEPLVVALTLTLTISDGLGRVLGRAGPDRRGMGLAAAGEPTHILPVAKLESAITRMWQVPLDARRLPYTPS